MCSRYRPGVAQRVGRGIALLFLDRGTRRGWVVSSTPRPHFTPGKDPVPILQEAGWAPGPVWKGRKSHPHRDSIPDRPARSQSLYRLSYPAHIQSQSAANSMKWRTTEAAKIPQSFFVAVVRALVYRCRWKPQNTKCRMQNKEYNVIPYLCHICNLYVLQERK